MGRVREGEIDEEGEERRDRWREGEGSVDR